MTAGIIIGTIPLAIVGLVLKKIINAPGTPFRSLIAIGIACIVMSLLLALAEFKGSRKRGFEQLTLQDGLGVRVAQALAIVPGVSRSGSTITAALFLGMERETRVGTAHRLKPRQSKYFKHYRQLLCLH
jgi:undecaprenyl-diphosphatase